MGVRGAGSRKWEVGSRNWGEVGSAIWVLVRVGPGDRLGSDRVTDLAESGGPSGPAPQMSGLNSPLFCSGFASGRGVRDNLVAGINCDGRQAGSAGERATARFSVFWGYAICPFCLSSTSAKLSAMGETFSWRVNQPGGWRSLTRFRSVSADGVQLPRSPISSLTTNRHGGTI